MLSSLLLSALLNQDPPLVQPESKSQVKARLHTPDVVSMSASERLKGYEIRLRRESDSPFQRVMWRSLGPEIQGGRVIDIESPESLPKQTLVAYATGGLWRTNDDGITWESLFDHESSFGIGDFAVSKDGKTIWVGSGENNSQRTSYSGTGIFKSNDAGKTWSNMGLPESHHIGRVVIDPKNESTVWVAALGHLYSQNEERGVYKTTDGGKTWKQILKVDKYTGAIDLILDPRDSKIAYASTWDRDRRAWNFREGGSGSAIYKTTDGGSTWRKLTSIPLKDDCGRIGLAIARSKPDRIYAFLDNQNPDQDTDTFDERQPDGRLTIQRFRWAPLDAFLKVDESKIKQFLNIYLPDDQKSEDVLKQLKDGKLDKAGLSQLFLKKSPKIFDQKIRDAEVWRSDDGGKSWVDASNRMGAHGGYYGGNITVDPKNPDLVYTCGLLLLRSKNAGKSWEAVARNSHVDFHVVYVDPRDSNKVWEGCDGGLYLSGDAGENWKAINNLAVGQFTTIAVDDKSPYNVYGGLQDNGTMKGPSTYVPGRSNPNAWTSIGGGDGSWIAVDPRNGGEVVYVASQWGDHSGLNQTTKESWSARAPGSDLRYNWISPLMISNFHSDIIYLGSQKLHRSFNQGKKYETISPDLTKNRPVGNVPHSTLTTISESPFKFGMIYCGTDDGNVWLTPDGGNSWVDIKTPQTEKWVTRIMASKWDANTVYCSQNGYREDDFNPYVWKSIDNGKTWKSIAGDLPAECINTVREDPVKKDILWVGTDMGVYVSTDGGKHWDTFGGGLPHTPVHDLAIQPKAKEMVIASHARSVWAVSTEPVYDLSEEIKAAESYFWTTSDINWSDRWGYNVRGEWDKNDPQEPQVTIKFYTSLRGSGQVSVKDKEGKEVKTMSYDVAPGYNFLTIGLQLQPGKPFEPGNFSQAKTGEDVVRDPYGDRRAKYLGKGEYSVEISVAGKILKTKFKVS